MNEKYKLSRYAILTDIGEAIIIYNTLNSSMVYFNEQKYIDIIKAMFINNTVTDDIVNETILFNKLYELQVIFDNYVNEVELANLLFLNKYKANKTLKLLIYVTNDCNFKCVYCPQKHTKIYMTEETMRMVVETIDKIVSTHEFENLVVSWFGGEPLLNLSIIEYGMGRLIKICEQYKLKIFGGITTNGYLLNECNIKKLFKIKVLDYQITLDGQEEIHNKNRKLINGFGTWKTIWNNLEAMKKFEDEFVVNLRINVNMDNVDDVIPFVNMIHNTLDNRYVIKIQPIMNMGNTNPDTTYCTSLESQIIQLNLYEYMSKTGCEDLSIDLTIERFGLMCNCSDPNYYVIKEDGKLCKCELNVDREENHVGNIYNNIFDINSLKICPYIVPSTQKECLECRLYPLCFGLTCPYKRLMKQPCMLKDTFLIEEYIKSISQKLLRCHKNDI